MGLRNVSNAHLTTPERRRQERRLFRVALCVSLLAHLLVFAFWRSVPVPLSPFAAAGPRAGDPRAASGSMEALRLAEPPPRPIILPLVPLISLDLPDTLVLEPDPGADLASLLGERPGTGAAPGAGLEGGTGRGDGGTGAEGLFRLVPPSPRGMIIPPTNPRLRGRQVEVWVFVNEEGRVVPDSTRLIPPTSDRGFNRRLVEEAAEWVFTPATQAGKPVAAWFPYTISM